MGCGNASESLNEFLKISKKNITGKQGHAQPVYKHFFYIVRLLLYSVNNLQIRDKRRIFVYLTSFVGYE